MNGAVMIQHPDTQQHRDRVSILGIILGTPLFMLGAALMVSIVGFPIGVFLFAAGLGLMTTPRSSVTQTKDRGGGTPHS